MDVLIYALDFALLLSCLIDTWCRRAEQRFSLGIVRTLLLTPLLALAQLYFSANMAAHLVPPLFLAENVFALSWILLAVHLQPVMTPSAEKAALYRIAPFLVVITGLGAGVFWIYSRPIFQITGNTLVFLHFGGLFVSSLFVLVSVLAMAWRLEAFWRSLDRKARVPYRHLMIGFFLIIGSMGWSTSFRLTYLCLKTDHLLLLSLLLLLGWCLAAYAVSSSRLLNRKIFVSRKIVYATIAPLVFAVYLISVGLISFLMATFGWSLHFVLKWLLIVMGGLLIASFSFSGRVRARIRYFISTHFYVNKYEYRDDWLNFSNLLHHKLTEPGVVYALRHILSDSLYTDTIKIWIGNEKKGFQLTNPAETMPESRENLIPANDSLIHYLRSVSYLDCHSPPSDAATARLLSEKRGFLESLGLVLLVPIAIGGHLLGIIGLGPEYTGGKYGKDDFDLLAAISSQAASVLLAVRTAEELAKAREQSAWHTLSAFVLHDIKNAATMLSLVQKNAPQHINNPEFQEDMLSSVDDALKRIAKVQERLNTLRGNIEPAIKALDARQFLHNACTGMSRKLPLIEIDFVCPADQSIHTDPSLLAVILENLLLNAMEAGSRKTDPVRVQIRLSMIENDGFQVECTDNGPGIPPDLLPDHLFEPFITAKPRGSGIGLWQVKSLVESLGGKITAQNIESGGGARFLLKFP
ncbi:MAG: PEP-CTERM system histidine kinase PrsK [Desulfosalsimonadaceae bacterium]